MGGIKHGCFQWILDFIVDRTPLQTTEKKIQQVNLKGADPWGNTGKTGKPDHLTPALII